MRDPIGNPWIGQTDPPRLSIGVSAESPDLTEIRQYAVASARSQECRDAIGDEALGDAVEGDGHAVDLGLPGRQLAEANVSRRGGASSRGT